MVGTTAARGGLSWLRLRQRPFLKTADVVRACGFYEPPVDIKLLATMLGIGVQEVSSPGWSGACQFDPNIQQAHVWIRAEDHYLRKRFTLAHEIGHIVLDAPGVAYRDVEFDGPEEARANGYAAGLLMPEFMLTPLLPYLGSDIPQLARQFDVSEGAMRFRIKKLYS